MNPTSVPDHDTDLGPEILNHLAPCVVEATARHLHDVWVRARISDGWTFGTMRRDDRKEHPLLVPFDEMTESDREFDRQMAKELLQKLMQRGWLASNALAGGPLELLEAFKPSGQPD